MRLRTVSIKGFKSFADSTHLHFNEDVTGIVGPNGSGKSNIVDAIRWVLGEMKNKELRLDKMNDVIFNGTKKRKRSGAAKVTLTFENTRNLIPTEYHSVSLSRLLYQNGDSEYRLNDVTCRRKDILNLFVDTGIGSNSYAIIGQGNINQVVEGREGSRRKMIEQAAGISKYKTRKKEAQQKLNATDADLARVEDLLFELERNLKDLERQAKRAKKYKEVKEEYREKSIQLAVVASNKYRKEYQDLKEKITQEKEHLTGLRAELHTSEAELETLKKRHVDLEQTVSSSQKEMNHLLDELRRKESAKEIKRQRLQFLNEDVVRLRAQRDDAETKLAGFKAELEEVDGRRVQIQTAKEEKESAAATAQQSYDNLRAQHESARKGLSAFMENKQALSSRVFNLEKGIAVNKNKIEGHQFSLEKMGSTIEDAQSQYDGLKGELTALQKQRDLLESEITNIQTREEERASTIAELEQQLSELRQEMAQAQRSLDQKSNEHDLLKNMVESLEGFPESVRFLSSQWQEEKVLLSDIIDCPQEYRAALESYLEPYLNHFIVQNKSQAIEAVNILAKSQKGKAQFFLLDEVGQWSNPSVEDVPDGCVSARSVLRGSSPYKAILDKLLANVYITDQDGIFQQYNGPGALLLQDGSRISQQAQIKGGSVGLFEGKKLGRKKELEHLAHQIGKLTSSLSVQGAKEKKCLDQLHQLKEESHQTTLKEKEMLFRGMNERYITSKTRLEGLKLTVQQNQSAQKELATELVALESSNGTMIQQLDVEKQKLDNLESEIENRGGDVDQWVGKISLAAEELNKANKSLMLAENEERSLTQRIDFLNSQYQSNEKLIKDTGMRLKDEEEEQRNLNQQLNQLEEELLKEYETKGQIQTSLNEVEKDYYEERKKIVQLEEQVREYNRRIRSHQESQEKNTQRYSDVRLKLHSITDRMEVEFNITLKEIMDNSEEITLGFEELEERVQKLRRRIENFGEINPMALEAYEEMKIRYDSIIQQRQDIFDAKASLEATIKEIEDQATTQFFEAFDKVKMHFKEVFRQLFTEDDDCDLILTEPEDPLNSGIEVVARPKGKRPKTLTQLSGGEKAMTAIALLFSLYLLKPAPFCIFDEVDAPFDDMNVSKFNEIMRRFSEQSQFIVITHNKLTMAKMDVLYGIFMQEPGVSAVSQVDFRSFKDELIFEAN